LILGTKLFHRDPNQRAIRFAKLNLSITGDNERPFQFKEALRIFPCPHIPKTGLLGSVIGVSGVG
jgi:hypothetical protein